MTTLSTQASLPAVKKARSFQSVTLAVRLSIFTIAALFLCASPFIHHALPAEPKALAYSRATDAAASWPITLEEPTGIYRRDNEIVTVRLSFAIGEARAEQLRVLSPDGREVVSQIAVSEKHNDGSIKSAELMFPATIVPGERPEFRLIAESVPRAVASGSSVNARSLPVAVLTQSITARRVGVGRVELANDRFGVMVNLGLEKTEPALVAAFNKSAGEQRMLNLIDTSPDVTEPLAFGKQSAGFGTFLDDKIRSGVFDQVEILEAGPLRARARLSGSKLGNSRESWEFTWYANSPVLHWRTSIETAEANSNYGFFFSSVSATPYEPFNKWMEGSEQTKFPDGWEVDNPPDHKISANDFADLPGKHLVYYQREQNYGAIGFYELDSQFEWRGIGSRQFYATKKLTSGKSSSEIAIAFPNWKGTTTVLEARKEYRKFVQPILAVRGSQFAVHSSQFTSPSQPPASPNSESAIRNPQSAIESFSLDGSWKLNSAEKSEGEKYGFYRVEFDDSAWRAVQVPGTVHTQILESPKSLCRRLNGSARKNGGIATNFQSIRQRLKNVWAAV